MGFYAFLETDKGDLMSIDGDDGVNMGKALAAFLGSYLFSITKKVESPERKWIKRLEEKSGVDIQTLTKIFYGEDLLYKCDEYKRFIVDWGSIVGKMSKEEFNQRLDALEMMWTPIDELILIVAEVTRLLPEMGEEPFWYVAEDTQPTFRGFLNTLLQAKRRGGKYVRILFL